jgi:hypothetical protein
MYEDDEEETNTQKIKIPKHQILFSDFESFRKEPESVMNTIEKMDKGDKLQTTSFKQPTHYVDPKKLMERILECNIIYYILYLFKCRCGSLFGRKCS